MMIRKLLFSLIYLFSNFVMAIEEPSFTISDQEAPFEIRQYEPMIIAEVIVDGTRDEASNKGFRMIADFIFGNNEASSKESQKIAMTAPVTIEPQKIAMTAPVTIDQSSDKGWRVQFVMPRQYTMETLPKPKNPLVHIKEITGKRYAAMRFSGFNNQEKIENNTQQLREWIEAKHLYAIGQPQLARYNPPWTLPPWRRNEILIEIAP
jgi:hypothetical protein